MIGQFAFMGALWLADLHTERRVAYCGSLTRRLEASRRLAEFDAQAERPSIEVCGLSREDLKALIEHRAGSSKGPGRCDPPPRA